MEQLKDALYGQQEKDQPTDLETKAITAQERLLDKNSLSIKNKIREESFKTIERDSEEKKELINVASKVIQNIMNNKENKISLTDAKNLNNYDLKNPDKKYSAIAAMCCLISKLNGGDGLQTDIPGIIDQITKQTQENTDGMDGETIDSHLTVEHGGITFKYESIAPLVGGQDITVKPTYHVDENKNPTSLHETFLTYKTNGSTEVSKIINTTEGTHTLDKHLIKDNKTYEISYEVTMDNDKPVITFSAKENDSSSPEATQKKIEKKETIDIKEQSNKIHELFETYENQLMQSVDFQDTKLANNLSKQLTRVHKKINTVKDKYDGQQENISELLVHLTNPKNKDISLDELDSQKKSLLHNITKDIIDIGISMIEGLNTAFSETSSRTYAQVIASGNQVAGTLKNINNYIQSEAGFLDMMKQIKDNPAMLEQFIAKGATDITSAVNESNIYTTMTGFNESLQATASFEDILGKEKTIDGISTGLGKFFEHTTEVQINGQTLYVPTKQFESQGFSLQKGALMKDGNPADQIFLDARQKNQIATFSVSDMVKKLSENKHIIIKSETDLNARTDNEQHTFLQQIANKHPHEFSEKDAKYLNPENNADNIKDKITTSNHSTHTEVIKTIKDQKAIEIRHGLIGNIPEQPKHGIYKIQVNDEDYYLNEKEFAKFSKPYTKNTRSERKDTEKNEKTEQESLLTDPTKLFLQTYGINEKILADKNITLESRQQGNYILFSKENEEPKAIFNTKTKMLSYNIPDITTEKHLQTIKLNTPTAEHITRAYDISTEWKNLYDTRYTDNKKSKKPENHTQRAHQLTFLETYAPSLITGDAVRSVNTSVSSEESNGFGEDIDFSKGGITIEDFQTDPNTNVLSYKKSSTTSTNNDFFKDEELY